MGTVENRNAASNMGMRLAGPTESGVEGHKLPW